ncbi:MAG: LuxR C-terminal-related transcriptional regulator [Dehalococcoidia bacterium]
MASKRNRETRADPIMSREPILATKLLPPPSRPGALPRPHLVAALNAGLSKRLTLISAPPGFGKTSVLSEWLALRTAPPAAWLSLDEADDDITRFLHHLLAAVDGVEPGAGDAPLNLLRPPTAAPVKAVLESLINATTASIHREVAIVLDDYDRVSNPAVHEALDFLLDRLPPHLHLYISTRGDPPLALARLRAGDQLNELGADDLRFNTEEMETFCRDVIGLNLGAGDMEELARRVEGWPVGLQLAGLALKQAGKPLDELVAAFDGSHRYVVDYLADEVLRRQEPEVRAFLLETSILDRLTPALCAVVTGRADDEMLSRLEEANLFIQRVDEARREYRYHTLFAGFLRERFEREDPEGVAMAHRRAAGWFESHGQVAEAIHHALAAGEPERAVALVEASAPDLVRKLEWGTIGEWFSQLPEEALLTRPELTLTYVRALASGEQFDKAASWLERVEAIARERADGDLLGRLRTVEAYIAGRRGDQERALELCQEALALLPATALPQRSNALWTMGTAYEFSGDLKGATASYLEAIEISQQTPGFAPNWVAVVDLAYAQFEQGRLNEGARIFQRVLSGSNGSRAVPAVRGVAHAEMGELSRERNQIDVAEKHLQAALNLLQTSGNINALLRAYRYLAKVRMAAGDLEAAIATTFEGERMAAERGVAHAVPNLTAARARFHCAIGNEQAAAEWAENSGLGIEDDLARISHLCELEYLALADVLASQRRHDDALRLLTRLEESSRAAARGRNLVQIAAQRSLALAACGEQATALAALRDGLSLAQPEGYLRTFIDQGPRMRELLSRLLAEGLRIGLEPYARRVLSLFPEVAAGNGRSAQRVLSEREIEVLDLLDRGLSNLAIAQEIVVTEGTVKRHVHNIFRKLDVHSRTQALARARRLNLLVD